MGSSASAIVEVAVVRLSEVALFIYLILVNSRKEKTTACVLEQYQTVSASECLYFTTVSTQQLIDNAHRLVSGSRMINAKSNRLHRASTRERH